MFGYVFIIQLQEHKMTVAIYTLISLEDYGFSDCGGADYIGALRQGNEIEPLIV